MAGFNLTAQLNLVGPTNVKKIASDIRRDLSSIDTNVNVRVDPKSVALVKQLTGNINQLSSGLKQISGTAQQTSTDINKMGQSLNSIRTDRVAKDTQQAAKATQRLGEDSRSAARDVKVMGTELAEFGRQSGLAIRRFAAFSLVSGIMYKMNSAVNSSIDSFIAFDKEIVRLSQVTGKQVGELQGLIKTLRGLSTNLGVSSDELIKVTSTLAQAGLTARQTEEALKALALSVNAPSFDNLTDTTEGVIAAMRQFNIDAKDLTGVLGSINAVSAQFAVEAGDIIKAIQRTGGVFASASKGVAEGTEALNQFIAIFTQVRATTRESAETIATGLRTIFARIQRKDTIESLREFGVELTDLEGKFVGPYEAIARLSAVLNQLDPRSLEVAKITEELGGFRQIGKVIPLIQQFSTAQAALNAAQAGSGSLLSDNAKAQQALAVQLTKVREEFKTLISDIGNNAALQAFLKITLSLTTGVLKLAQAGKSLFPILTLIAGMKGVSAITEFAGGFLQGIDKVPNGPEGKKQSRSRTVGAGISGLLTGSGSGDNNREFSDLSAQINSLIPAIGNMTAIINQQIAETNANTAALTLNTTSIDALAAVVQASGATGLYRGGKVMGFKTGGLVPGNGGGDRVPALLEGGEVVMSRDAVKRYGAGNLVRMNNYASGGTIEQIRSLKPGRGDNKIADYVTKYPKINDQDYVSSNIERIQISAQDIALASGNYKTFKDQIQNLSEPYKGVSRYSAEGFAFEDWIKTKSGEKMLGDKGLDLSNYEPTDRFHPVDFIGKSNRSPVEIKFKHDSEPDEFILNKHLRYILSSGKWQSKQFTPNVDPDVRLGTIKLVEMGAGAKDRIYNPEGVSQSTLDSRKHRREEIKKQISSAGFMAGGTVEETTPEYLQSLVDRINAVGGVSDVIRLAGVTDVIKRGSLKKTLNGVNVKMGRNIDTVLQYLEQAETAAGVKAVETQKEFEEAREGAFKVQIAGMLPVGHKWDKVYDLGGREVNLVARGLDEKYRPAVERMQESTRNIVTSFGSEIQNLYGEPGQLTATTPEEDELFGQGNIEGAVIEKALYQLGAPLVPGSKQNRRIDYIGGLGVAAKYFTGLSPNIPTEVKRIINRDSLADTREKIAKGFAENLFASGGLVQRFANGGSADRLVQDLQTALKEYTLGDHKTINSSLRKDETLANADSKIKQTVSSLDELMKYDVPSNLYAGIGSGKTSAILDYAEWPGDYESLIGQYIDFADYFSTSTNRDVADLFAGSERGSSMLDIKPKGKGIDVIQAYKDFGLPVPQIAENEEEFILPRGSSFRIDNAEGGDGTYFDLTQLKLGGLIQKLAGGGESISMTELIEQGSPQLRGRPDSQDELRQYFEDMAIGQIQSKLEAQKLLGKKDYSKAMEYLIWSDQEDQILKSVIADAQEDPMYGEVLSEFEGKPMAPRTKALVDELLSRKLDLYFAIPTVSALGPNITPELLEEGIREGYIGSSLGIDVPSSIYGDKKKKEHIPKGDYVFFGEKLKKFVTDKDFAKIEAKLEGSKKEKKLRKLDARTEANLGAADRQGEEILAIDLIKLFGEQQRAEKELMGGSEADRLEQLASMIAEGKEDVPELGGDPDLAKRTNKLITKWNSAAKKGDWTRLGLEQSAIDAILEDINDSNIFTALSGGKLARAAGKFKEDFALALAGKPLNNAQSARDLQQIVKAITVADYASGGLVQNFEGGGVLEALKTAGMDNLGLLGAVGYTAGSGAARVGKRATNFLRTLLGVVDVTGITDAVLPEEIFKNLDVTETEFLLDPTRGFVKGAYQGAKDSNLLGKTGKALLSNLNVVGSLGKSAFGGIKGLFNEGGQATYNLGKFAAGGTIPAMVSNGEAFVPPETAKKIGYANLEKMNQADRNGMTGFASGGISVFKGPGHGTSDSIGPVGLPVGSFVIREKATKALGLNKGGSVGVKHFKVGGQAEAEAVLQAVADKFGTTMTDVAARFGKLISSFAAKARKDGEKTSDIYRGSIESVVATLRENVGGKESEKLIKNLTGSRLGISAFGARGSDVGDKDAKLIFTAITDAIIDANAAARKKTASTSSLITEDETAASVGVSAESFEDIKEAAGLAGMSLREFVDTVSNAKNTIFQQEMATGSRRGSARETAEVSVLKEFVPTVFDTRDDTDSDSFKKESKAFLSSVDKVSRNFAGSSGSETLKGMIDEGGAKAVNDIIDEYRQKLSSSLAKAGASVELYEAKMAEFEAGISKYSGGRLSTQASNYTASAPKAIAEIDASIADFGGVENAISSGDVASLRALEKIKDLLGVYVKTRPGLTPDTSVKNVSFDSIGSVVDHLNQLSDFDPVAFMDFPATLVRIDKEVSAAEKELADTLKTAFSGATGTAVERKAIADSSEEVQGARARLKEIKETRTSKAVSVGTSLGLDQDAALALTEYYDKINEVDKEVASAAENANKAADAEEKAVARQKQIRAEELKNTSAWQKAMKARMSGGGVDLGAAKAAAEEELGFSAEAQKRMQAAAEATAQAMEASVVAAEQLRQKEEERRKLGGGVDGGGVLAEASMSTDAGRAIADQAQKAREAAEALAALKQKAIQAGEARAKVATGAQRSGESDEDYQARYEGNLMDQTRRSAKELGLVKTRVMSPREAAAEEEKAQKAEQESKKETEQKSADITVKAQDLLIQAINENTKAITGNVEATTALESEMAALETARSEVQARNQEGGDTSADSFDINDAFEGETYTITALDVIDDFGAMMQEKANGIAAAFTDLEGNTSAFGGFVQGLGGKLASGADAAKAGLASVNEQFINSKVGGVFKGLSSLGGLLGGFIGTAGLQMAGEAAGGYDSAMGGSLLVGADVASAATAFATAGSALGPFGTAVGAVAGSIYGLVDGISKWQDALEESRLAALEDAATRASEQSTMDFGVFFDSIEPDFDDFASGIQNLNEVLSAEAEIVKGRMTDASTSTYMGFGKQDLEGPELTNWAQEMASINAQAGAISKDVIRRFMSAGKSVEDVAGILGPQQFEGFKQQIAEADAVYQRQVAEAARVAKSDAEFADAVQEAKDAAFERSVSDLKVKEANEDFAKNVTEVRKRLESTGVGILEKIIGNTPEENEKYAKSLSMASQLMEGNVNATKAEEEKAFNEAYNQAGGGIEGQRAGEAAAAQVRKETTAAGNELLSLGDQTDPEIRKQRAAMLRSQLEAQGIDPSQGLAAKVLESLNKEDPTLEAQKNTAKNTELLTKQMAELLGKDLGLASDTGPKTRQEYLDKLDTRSTGFQGFYEQNQTGVLAAGGIAAAAGAAAMVPGVRRGARSAYRTARERAGQMFTPDADMPKPKTGTGGDAGGAPKSKPAGSAGGSGGTGKPKTSAPKAPRRPKAPKPKVGGRGRAGLIGLGLAAVSVGAGYFMGSGSANADEGGGDSSVGGGMESPQVVSLLAAIEKNTRCACSGEGRSATPAGGGAFSIPPETLGMRLSPDQAIKETLTDTSLTAQQRNIDVGMNISDSLAEQGIDTTMGDTGAAIASVMSAPEAVTQEQLGDTRAAIVADQLTAQGIDIDTDVAQAALNAIATSTDPAIASFANIAAITDDLAKKLGSVGDAAMTSASTTEESGKEVRNSTLDWIQGGLTAVGMLGDFVPIAGNLVAIGADLTNSAISGTRAAMSSDPGMRKGFMIDAGINAAAAVPYAGLAAGALKGTQLAAKAGAATAKLGTTGAKVATGAAKIGVDSAGMALGGEASIAAIEALPEAQKNLANQIIETDEAFQMQVAEISRTAKTDEEYRKAVEDAKAATIQRINESGGFETAFSSVVGSSSGGEAKALADGGENEDWIGSAIGAAGSAIGSGIDALASALGSVLSAIPGVLDYTLRTAIPAIGSALLSAGIATAKLIWDGLKALPGFMYNAAVTTLGAVWDTLGVLGSVAVDLGKAAIAGVWAGLKALPGWLLETAMSALGGLWSGITALPGFIYETGMSALSMLWTGVVEIPGLIISAVGNIGSMIGSAFQAVGGMIGEGLYAAGSYVVQTASDAFTWLSENWYKIPGLLWDAIKGWGAYLAEVFSGITTWIGGQMYRVMTNIFNGINDIAFKVLSSLPMGKSVAKGLGLKDPNSQEEQDRRALQAQSWQQPAIPKPPTQAEEASGTTISSQGIMASPITGGKMQAGGTIGTLPATTATALPGSMNLQQAQGLVANQQNVDTSNLYQGGAVGAGGIDAALNQYDQIQALDEAKKVVAANEAANVAMDMVPQAIGGPGQKTGGENLIGASQQTSGGGVSTGSGASDMQAAASQVGTTIAATFGTGATDALQATFGGFIEQLGAIQFPQVPDVINMQGTHTVEVVINGAEAFKGMQESIKTMISEQINEKVKWINNQTEGGLGP